MIWPTVCIDNFFDNPYKVVETDNSFPYKKDETGKWPGKRCEHVGNLHYELFLYSTKKIVASIFPNFTMELFSIFSKNKTRRS